MDDVLDEDLQQLYQNSIVLFMNKPVYVEAIGRNRSLLIYDLIKQRSKQIKFSVNTVKPPTMRIGMVNIAGSVVYVTRMPVRKYKVGYTVENLKFHTLEVNYPAGKAETKHRLMSLKAPELADSMFNAYPSIDEAATLAEEIDGAYAFDRQFAVDSRRRLWYKTKIVGGVPRNAKEVSDLAFNAENKHLIQLLGEKYDTAISSSE